MFKKLKFLNPIHEHERACIRGKEMLAFAYVLNE